MTKYKFSSVFDLKKRSFSRNFGVPDISMFADLSKGEYMKAGKRYEQHLADLVGLREDCNDFLYWIIADQCKIVAGVNMFDNATLVAEALLCFSPYYSVIDVFGYSGLMWHAELLDDDLKSKERRFHERTNHIPASEWPYIKRADGTLNEQIERSKKMEDSDKDV